VSPCSTRSGGRRRSCKAGNRVRRPRADAVLPRIRRQVSDSGAIVNRVGVGAQVTGGLARRAARRTA
jgi:hypothetical protein